MSTINSNNWAGTALVSLVAASIGSYIVLNLFEKRRKDENTTPPPYKYPFPATFLESGRTRCDSDAQSYAKGWTMQDALANAEKNSDQVKKLMPAEVLLSLQKGNSRFYSNRAKRPEVSAFERRTLIKQQFPCTAILGCSDSRVPVEIVFDQGLGDMFVVRVAGNCLGPGTEASLEFAVHHLKVKVLLVMGHEGCGAIKAAGLPVEMIEQETKSLSVVLKKLKKGLNEDHLHSILDQRAKDREAVAMNVRRQVEALTNDEKIMECVNSGKLLIVGAFYEISSGIVDFFMQVSKDEGEEFKPAPGVQSRYNVKTNEIIYA